MRYLNKIVSIIVSFISILMCSGSTLAEEVPSIQWNDLGEITNLYKEWTITFNVAVDPSSLTATSIVVKSDEGETVPVSLKVSNNKMIVSPVKNYKNYSNYTLSIASHIKSINGISLSNEYKATFTTNAVAHSEYYKDKRITWLWNPWSLIENEREILYFLESEQLSKVYLQIDYAISVDVYRSFIEKAAKKGIETYALAGEDYWTVSKTEEYFNELMNWFTTYQTQSTSSQQFLGFHLDIEPYLNSNWATKQEELVNNYQTFMQLAQAGAKQHNISIEADIPFWYEEIQYNNRFGKGNLAEWVIQHTDSITIMAYRDRAEAIIDIASNEMALAEKYGKSVVIGVETMQSDEDDIVSFYEEGTAFMEEELVKVIQYYKHSQSFNGIAIHHYESWKELRK